MSQPGITESVCYTAVCGGCDEPFGDDDYTLSYTTETRLLEQLRTYGWDVLQDRLRCPNCRDRELCERVGHDWSEWSAVMCRCGSHGVPRHEVHDGCLAIRACERCGKAERRDPEWTVEDDADVARLLGGGSR